MSIHYKFWLPLQLFMAAIPFALNAGIPYLLGARIDWLIVIIVTMSVFLASGMRFDLKAKQRIEAKGNNFSHRKEILCLTKLFTGRFSLKTARKVKSSTKSCSI